MRASYLRDRGKQVNPPGFASMRRPGRGLSDIVKARVLPALRRLEGRPDERHHCLANTKRMTAISLEVVCMSFAENDQAYKGF